MTKLFSLGLAAIVCGLLLPSSADAQYGDVKGQFVLDGDVPSLDPLVKKGDPTAKDPEVCAASDVPDESVVVNPENKGIANIVLFPSRSPKDINPAMKDAPAEPVVFDQKACQFFPHILVVRAGQEVVVKSDDECAHNVRSSFIRNTPFNFTVAPKDREGQTIDNLDAAEPLPMPIKCDIHPYMQAYWIIADHPYVGVTDKDGNFEIKGLPAGKHTFRVWHEKAGYIERSFKIEVEAGEMTDLGVTKVDAKDLED